ncbi:uncharacterized protein ATNIH1004_010261 [Aspergillus tanneri]|uniref:Uncharacterized protein n=1 Tax=Aspergillus tanneri TaxID=1220188 RepID=A0A5M9M8W0_9EURO|nr:uncharacterized protein ATNIH1004_010261 [Aspergillus tanneri]KAA8643492.1 hypothetical protein ATNIH1004_010261 [Aspergillus tanneri]
MPIHTGHPDMSNQWTPEDERRLIRRIDMYLMVLCTLLDTAGNQAGEILGALISYGVVHYTGPCPQWKMLFLILGSITIIWSVVLGFALPDSPRQNVFPVPDGSRTGIFPSKKFQHVSVFHHGVMLFLPSDGVTSFSTIISSFGFSIPQTVLMGLPSTTIQLISLCIISTITSTLHSTRLPSLAALYVVALVGFLTIMLDKTQPWSRLMGFWLCEHTHPCFRSCCPWQRVTRADS